MPRRRMKTRVIREILRLTLRIRAMDQIGTTFDGMNGKRLRYKELIQ